MHLGRRRSWSREFPACQNSRGLRADEVENILSTHFDPPPLQRWELSGLIHVGGEVPATIDRARAELWHEEELIGVCQVSPRGRFSFASVEPGKYELNVVWDKWDFWLREVKVE